MPKMVAQFTISAAAGASFFDSTLMLVVAASELALRSCAEVIVLLAWITQPPRLFWFAMCRRRSALSVITVLGADVPAGSRLSTCTTGCATHEPGEHEFVFPFGPPGPRPDRSRHRVRCRDRAGRPG